jgi:hypothetical protein
MDEPLKRIHRVVWTAKSVRIASSQAAQPLCAGGSEAIAQRDFSFVWVDADGLSRDVHVANCIGAKVLAPLVSQSPKRGALPTLRAATDPSVSGGQYYGPGGLAEQRGHPKLVGSSSESHDEGLQLKLWKVSEELTGVTYPIFGETTSTKH